MAAGALAERGCTVTVYDAMPSVGRKFLLAGRGGLNLTHAEPWRTSSVAMAPAATRRAAHRGLSAAGAARMGARPGVETFVGSSAASSAGDEGRAAAGVPGSPACARAGVRFAVRHRWLGWAEDPRRMAPATDAADDAPRAPAAPALRHPGRRADGRGRRARARARRRQLGQSSVPMAPGWHRCAPPGSRSPTCSPPTAVSTSSAPPARAGARTSSITSAASRSSVAARCTDPAGRVHARAGECLISATGIEGRPGLCVSPLRCATPCSPTAAKRSRARPRPRPQPRAPRRRARPPARQPLLRQPPAQPGRHQGRQGRPAARMPGEGRARRSRPPRRGHQGHAAALVATRPLDEAISSAGGVRFEAWMRT